MTTIERCSSLEDCYEFMLAYAAQGRPTDEGFRVRAVLEAAVELIRGLTDSYAAFVQGLEPANRYDTYLAVLSRDAADSLAAIELVLAQPVVSSQLVDDLNSSVHIRALLTDLFLVIDILQAQHRVAQPAVA